MDQTEPVAPEKYLAIYDLKYTPRGIKELEDATKTSIYNIVGKLEMLSILMLVQYGLYRDIDKRKRPLPEEQAYTVVEEWLESGQDMMGLQKFIIKKLEDQGFLARDLGLSKKMESAMEKVKNLGDSEISGELENLLQ